ncbi:Cation/H(+) antiporter 20 [Morus notabilis]|uniref:Cation/H(+) antiporter 20 n=1 Tax=Morus notabilis TaxID=981085 RepID=W9S891_9ROSA|nr:Cation/H(+) antiporter 20 [Morus notabilis]
MVNTTRIETSSDGAWQGDNPFHFAFPLLILQTILVLFISRFLAFLLKPLRQPKVIAEILGGILLGPSALGRNEDFLRLVFPSWSTPILESVASIGLLFFLFLVGIELDLSSIRRTGRSAFAIALAGISIPFIFGVGITFILRRAVKGEEHVGYAQYLVFMGVSLSVTAFPVLARILAELKLLTTQVGETAMAAAAFNDVAAWILLALAVALSGGNEHRQAFFNSDHKSSPLVSVWVLLSGFLFVAFMLVLVRRLMNWVSQPRRNLFQDEACICLTLAGVMASGFVTDLIGIHSIFGAFVFGLTIPKGGEFERRLIERIEDFVLGLLMPLYFASSGLKTDITKIRGAQAWALLLLVIFTSCAGKILGTFVVAVMCMIPVRESFKLGVLMNTKGLVELIVLNIGKEKKVLNDEMFAILVLMALFTTFMTTPTVIAIYKSSDEANNPNQRQQNPMTESTTSKSKTKDGHNNHDHDDRLRILACIHGPESISSLVNLIDSLRTKSPLKLYVMHLVELTDRSSSIMMVQRSRKNGFPLVNRFRRGGGNSGASLTLHEQVAAAFEAYMSRAVGGELVTVRHSTSVSALSTMHEDILHVVEAKRVLMILLPFHKQYRRDDGENQAPLDLGHDWRGVNNRVMKDAPCSVAVFIDRGLGHAFVAAELASSHAMSNYNCNRTRKVCVLFLGGADDREALELGWRMAQVHEEDFRVTMVRLLIKKPPQHEIINQQRYCCSISAINDEMEKDLDEAAMAELKRRCVNGLGVELIEKEVEGNLAEAVMISIGQGKVYELVIVGKGRFQHSTMVSRFQMEQADFGPIGETLASSQLGGIRSSVLVVQHQLELNKSTASLPKNMAGSAKDAMIRIRNEQCVV